MNYFEKHFRFAIKIKNSRLSFIINGLWFLILLSLAGIFVIILTTIELTIAIAVFQALPSFKEQFPLYITVMVFHGALVTICFNASNNTSDLRRKKSLYNIAMGLFFGLLNFGIGCTTKYLSSEGVLNVQKYWEGIIYELSGFLSLLCLLIFLFYTTVSIVKLYFVLLFVNNESGLFRRTKLD